MNRQAMDFFLNIDLFTLFIGREALRENKASSGIECFINAGFFIVIISIMNRQQRQIYNVCCLSILIKGNQSP
jgi:hypothetical protein